jgi:hypothetical protein
MRGRILFRQGDKNYVKQGAGGAAYVVLGGVPHSSIKEGTFYTSCDPCSDHLAAVGGVKKHYGELCNARGAGKILSGGDPPNVLDTDGTDSTNGSSFDSESYPDDALAHSSLKGDNRANGHRGAKEGEWSDNPD